MMHLWYARFLGWFSGRRAPERVRTPLDADTPPPLTARELVEMALNARPEEMGCDECFDELDRFVELQLAGKDSAAAMPLVEDHLRRCPPCREEYEALLLALQARR